MSNMELTGWREKALAIKAERDLLQAQVERLTQELAVANEHARKMTSERDIALIEGGKQVRTLRDALREAHELRRIVLTEIADIDKKAKTVSAMRSYVEAFDAALADKELAALISKARAALTQPAAKEEK